MLKIVRKPLLILLLVSLFPSIIRAETLRPITVYLNGVNLAGSQYGVEEISPIHQGRTFLDMDILKSSLGYQVEESKGRITIQKRDVVARMEMDKKDFFVGKEEKTMDVAPFKEKQKVYLPIRFIQEAFGEKIGWDGGNRVVIIDSKKNAEKDLDGFLKMEKFGLAIKVPESVVYEDLTKEYVFTAKEGMDQYSDKASTLFKIKKTNEPPLDSIEDMVLKYDGESYIILEYPDQAKVNLDYQEQVREMISSIHTIEK